MNRQARGERQVFFEDAKDHPWRFKRILGGKQLGSPQINFMKSTYRDFFTGARDSRLADLEHQCNHRGAAGHARARKLGPGLRLPAQLHGADVRGLERPPDCAGGVDRRGGGSTRPRIAL